MEAQLRGDEYLQDQFSYEEMQATNGTLGPPKKDKKTLNIPDPGAYPSISNR